VVSVKLALAAHIAYVIPSIGFLLQAKGGEPRLIHTVRGVGFRGAPVSLRLRVALFMALVVAAAAVAVSWAAFTSAQHEARSEVDRRCSAGWVSPTSRPGARGGCR